MWKEYQAEARKFQNPRLHGSMRREHALYGLASEVGEVMEAIQAQRLATTFSISAEKIPQICKEIGDCMWFLAELCDEYGIDLISDCNPNSSKDFLDLMAFEVDISDMTNWLGSGMGRLMSIFQHMYQGEPINMEVLTRQIGGLVETLAEIAYKYDMELPCIMAANIDKLKRRYPEGHYEDKRSVEREEH